MLQRMKELECTELETEQFTTIRLTDVPLKSGNPSHVQHSMHRVRLERLEAIAAKYAARAEELAKRCPPNR